MDNTQSGGYRLPKISKKAAIIFGSILVVIVIVVSLFNWVNSLQVADTTREVALTRQYESMKTGLDAFLSTAREQAGVTKAQSAAFDKIMLDAVQGRYDANGQPTGANPTGGSLFSAIKEAYPNLDTLNSSYSRILDTISSGRTAFANYQQRLQDELREYDQWRKSGIVHSWAVSHLIGAPTHNLVVVNGAPQYGQAAYNVMAKAIVSGQTSQSFKSGDLEPQDFFGN